MAGPVAGSGHPPHGTSHASRSLSVSERDRFKLQDSPFGPVMLATNTPPGSVALFTGAGFEGFLSGGGGERVRGWLSEAFGIDAPLVTCHQVHGTHLERAPDERDDWFEIDGCDALWTDSSSRAIAIKVADCVALLILDPRSGVAAGIHAGWRGASAGIVPKSLERLAAESQFDPGQALAWIGPAIRVCCFEVGEEVVDSMLERVPDLEKQVDRSRGSKPHLDLAAVVRADLVASGLKEQNISDSGVCTRCDEGFHSYRRGGRNAGRNLGVIAVGAPAREAGA